MAEDPELTDLVRRALDGRGEISEKRMFGGVCFFLNGHMLCSVRQGGGMARVGKAQESAARQSPGTGPLNRSGHPLPGYISVDASVWRDPSQRKTILDFAVAYASTLPPK